MKLKIRTENAAFDPMEWEVARILRKVAEDIENGEESGSCVDHNGNKVGEWEL